MVHGQQTDSVPTGQEYNRIRIFHYLKLYKKVTHSGMNDLCGRPNWNLGTSTNLDSRIYDRANWTLAPPVTVAMDGRVDATVADV